MSNSPTVSVMVPAYNAASYVGLTIQSILDQTYADFELIVVNDCSTDNTLEVIRSFDDERIKVYSNEENQGIAYTRNRLMDLSNGRYLAICDADDVCMPGRLEKQVQYLDNHQDHVAVGSSFEVIDQKGSFIREKVFSFDASDYFELIFFRNPFAQSSMMIRTSILKDQDLKYSLEYPPAEDFHLWNRLIRYGEIYNLPDKLIAYRVHTSNISVTHSDLMTSQLVKILRQRNKQEGLQLDDEEINVQVSILEGGLVENVETLVNYINKITSKKFLYSRRNPDFFIKWIATYFIKAIFQFPEIRYSNILKIVKITNRLGIPPRTQLGVIRYLFKKGAFDG